MPEKITRAEFEYRTKLGGTEDVIVEGLGYVFWLSQEGLAARVLPSSKTKSYVLNSYFILTNKVAVVLPTYIEPDYEIKKKKTEQELLNIFKTYYTDKKTNTVSEKEYNHIKNKINNDYLSLEDIPMLYHSEDAVINYFDYHEGFNSARWARNQTSIAPIRNDWGSESTVRENLNPLAYKILLPTLNTAAGIGITLGSNFSLAGQGMYVTSKGMVREISTLSKLTKHATPYAQAGKFLTRAAYVTYFGGIALDAYAYNKGDINEVHFGANTAVSTWGLGVSALGLGLAALPATIGYFGIDQFYPGGWPAALEDRDRREKEVQKVIPGYREVPAGPKW